MDIKMESKSISYQSSDAHIIATLVHDEKQRMKRIEYMLKVMMDFDLDDIDELLAKEIGDD
tara:strand:+ start:506 stop:688 length:183 start_codon:yes stop_codon:yes gene_type:complete